MIPVNRFNPAAADQLLQYALEEIFRARADRAPKEKKWLDYQRLYRMLPEEENKTFPFANCSNLVIGLIAADVETVHARTLAQLFTPPSLWKTFPLMPEMEAYSPRLEEFLKWAQSADLNMYPVVRDWILEVCKLGTGILKTRYNRESKKVYEFREVTSPMGGVQAMEQQLVRLVKDSPQVNHVSLFDFYVPASATDIVGSQWAAERFNPSWAQLVNRAKAGVYTNVDKLAPYLARSRGSQYEQQMQEFDRFKQSQGDRFELFEFWLDWDIDGDGEQEAIVMTMHEDSRTMVRLDFNPFFNQEKPYDFARYMAQEKRFYGIGIAEMLEMYQQEVSTMHNQRIDNNTLANAQVIIAQRNGNIKQDEPIFPGRVLLVDDVEHEVRMQAFGQIKDSTIEDEAATIQLAKQRTGVSDYIAGNSDTSVGYSAATTAIQQLREGAKRVDQFHREIRSALSSVGMKIVELYQQFSQGMKPYMVLGAKDGQTLQQVLQFPTQILRTCIGIDVTATSASYNKEVEIRTNTIILQMLTQFYAQATQALMAALNPMVPPPVRLMMMKAVQGGIILMQRILDDYGVQDSDNMLPSLQELFGNVQQQQAGFGGGFGAPQQPGFGPAPMGPGLVGPSGIPAIQQGTGGGNQLMLPPAGNSGFGQGMPPFAR